MTFVEQELVCREAGQIAFHGKTCAESNQAAGAAFGAGQGDVGMVRAGFGFEAAGCNRGHNALLECEKQGRGFNAQMKDAGALKDAEAGETNGDGRSVQFREPGGNAIVFLRRGVAEELEGDVPGFGRRPAKIGRGCAQAGDEPRKPGGYGLSQRKGKEEAHGVKCRAEWARRRVSTG
jgi:hypothetical protein